MLREIQILMHKILADRENDDWRVIRHGLLLLDRPPDLQAFSARFRTNFKKMKKGLDSYDAVC
jgi:hypothetical protein